MGGLGRTRSLWASCGVVALALCCSALCACKDEDFSCDAVEGQFLPEYQQVDGTCGYFDKVPLDIPAGAGANRMSNQVGAGGSTVRTTVNVSGCDLTFTQEAFLGQRRHWAMGGTLHVVSKKELEGSAYRIMYDENDQETCRANFGAVLRQGWQYGMSGGAGSTGL